MMNPIGRMSRLVLLIPVLVLGLGLATSPAFAGKLTLRVVADLGDLEVVATANGGPFYVPGEIFDPDTGDVIGRFHCWGWFFDAGTGPGSGAVVSQEWELFGRGKILVAGVEDEGPRAVTGGTGDFRNVRGEMTGADLSAFPDFTATFKLIGARN